ncbi:MAG: hypothetical protein ACYCZB_17960 [Acidiphilium sp.]
MTDGVAGLLHDKTRPSRVPPLDTETVARVVAATQADPPGETTHNAVTRIMPYGAVKWRISVSQPRLPHQADQHIPWFKP